ncbi:hypothetical protein SAY87_007233 [Trapa incisa]|uniref:Uncharacterized protein n=1 Tax=Trapa incisa TaxID=236973 RepID=A0AAN7JZX0_9MYRT|nr:hypothetical protein SAY87_007233 [Trapa incisa]
MNNLSVICLVHPSFLSAPLISDLLMRFLFDVCTRGCHLCGSPSLADQLNADAFSEQARSYDKASSNPVGVYIRNARTRQLWPPLPVLLASELDDWSRNQEYKDLLKCARQINSVQSV